MLLYLHSDEGILVQMLFGLLALAFLLAFFFISMFIVYKFVKKSKNGEIQELDLTEKNIKIHDGRN